MTTRRVVLSFVAVLLVSGAPAPPPAGAATFTDAVNCRKSVSTQMRVYAKKRQTFLLSCIDKMLKCEVQLELDGTNPGSCRDSAKKSCTNRLGGAADSALSKAKLRFRDKSTLSCLPVGLADALDPGPGGLWYGNDAECNGESDLPSLMECIREEIDEQVDLVVGTTKPRGAILLDNIGLGGEFPNLPRPPMVDVLVSATGPGTGVLVNPGTINVPQGSALRFSGDPATLPCGGGNNGRITITVGAGPTAQQIQVKEPFGANDVAIFGPWVTTTSLPYTIVLKDGSCDDTVSDTVDVP